MIEPRRIVVTVQSSVSCRTLLATGKEYSHLFGVPLHGLRVEESVLPEICDFPVNFLPRGSPLMRRRLDPKAMTVALRGETKQLRAEVARFASISNVEVQFTTETGELTEWLIKNVAPGDLVITPIDLSHRPLRPAVVSALRLCPPGGGILLVPERNPSSRGTTVALAQDPSDDSVSLALRIAAALGEEILVATEPSIDHRKINFNAVADASKVRVRRVVELPKDRRLDSALLYSEAIRLIVLSTTMLERLEIDHPDALIRVYRAPILILDRGNIEEPNLQLQ